MQATDRAYAAGILDGEGAIGITKVAWARYAGGFYFRGYVSVSNTSMPLLEWLKSKWGGTIHGPYNKKNPRQKPVYQWTLSGRNARALLVSTLAHLKLKNRQAEAVLRLGAIRGPYRRTRTKDGRHFAAGHQRTPEVQAEMESLHRLTMYLNHRGR